MIYFAPLASGSGGNATYVGTPARGLLIDAGITTRQIGVRLAAIGLGGAPVDAVLLTHHHGDHVAAVGVLDRQLKKTTGRPVPFWMTAGTLAGLREPPEAVRLLAPGQRVEIAGFQVEAVEISHDTAEPVAFAVDTDGGRVGVITDLGQSSPAIEEMLNSLTAAVLEFNHDLERLWEGPYPWSLKDRVAGPRGHLSNADAAALLARAASPHLRQLYLGHLSKENNTPALAFEAARAALLSRRLNTVVRVASPDIPHLTTIS